MPVGLSHPAQSPAIVRDEPVTVLAGDTTVNPVKWHQKDFRGHLCSKIRLRTQLWS